MTIPFPDGRQLPFEVFFTKTQSFHFGIQPPGMDTGNLRGFSNPAAGFFE